MSCILQEILSHSFSSNSALCAFQAGSQRTVLTETRYSFFLPAHECEQLMDHRWVFPLSLYFLEEIFSSIGKLVRFFPLPTLPQFALHLWTEHMPLSLELWRSQWQKANLIPCRVILLQLKKMILISQKSFSGSECGRVDSSAFAKQ